MSDPTIPAEALPELGTAEAAVRSCVNLISRATGQPEQLLAYWLDLYFQVRLKLEQPPAPPVQGSCREQPAAPRPPLESDEPVGISEQSQSAAPKKSPQAEAAEFKRATLARLEAALAKGIKMGDIAGGSLTDSQILSIRERKPMPITVYRELDHALDHFDF